MENITDCLVLLLSVSVAMGIDVNVYDRNMSTRIAGPLSAYTFEFHRGDYLTTQVKLLNKHPSTTAAVYSIRASSNNTKKEKLILEYYKNVENGVFYTCINLEYNDISLELEINTTTGPCFRKLIVVGTGVTGEIKGDGTCIQLFGCKIEVDLRNIECNDVKPIESTNIAVIIISSISGMAFVLLVTICIWKRCWIKRHQTLTPQIPPTEPFYLNMLFRGECEHEMAELEQHHYEEIH